MAVRVVRDVDIGDGLAIVADMVVANVDGGDIVLNGSGQISLGANAVTGAETPFTATGTADGFLAVTPGGTNGHAPTYAIDYTAAAFVEGVQDAVGQAILAGAGITYDDAADAISSALGNITFGNGLNFGAGVVTVLPDPASPYTVVSSVSGVSVIPVPSNDSGDGFNLFKVGTDNRGYVATNDVQGAAVAAASVELCGLDGTVIGNMFP